MTVEADRTDGVDPNWLRNPVLEPLNDADVKLEESGALREKGQPRQLEHRYDPQRHHRRSIRLKGYDYTQPGAYFVTIVCQHRLCLLEPDPVREMVQTWWDKLPEKFSTVVTDEFVIMPNHVHGIIVITYAATETGQTHGSATDGVTDGVDVGAGLVPALDGVGTNKGAANGATTKVAPTGAGARRPTLGDLIGAFKSLTTNAYIRGVRERGWPPFDGRLWQRNYYEHIIRDERELNATRRYIRDNPARWSEDAENPDVGIG